MTRITPRIATTLAVYPELRPFVETEWRAHCDDGFESLARTPSRGISGIAEAMRADPSFYTHERLMAHADGTDPQADRDRWVADATRRAMFGSGAAGPVFLEKAFLEEAVRRAVDEATRERAAASLAALAGVSTPKSTEVRSAINAVLKRLLGAKLASSGGGDWHAAFDLDGTALKLWVDTGGMARGFRYEFIPPKRPGTSMPAWFNYELALGMPRHAWDALRTDRLDAQIAMWESRLTRLLDAMRAIRWQEAAPHAG